jgi:hypothetical protein
VTYFLLIFLTSSVFYLQSNFYVRNVFNLWSIFASVSVRTSKFDRIFLQSKSNQAQTLNFLTLYNNGIKKKQPFIVCFVSSKLQSCKASHGKSINQKPGSGRNITLKESRVRARLKTQCRSAKSYRSLSRKYRSNHSTFKKYLKKMNFKRWVKKNSSKSN